jgi:glucose/arabinose dehydrogenase
MISACLAGFPAVLAAETPAQAATPPAVQTKAQPPAASLLSRLAIRYPVYATVEGQPIDPRPPEKSDDKPLFPEQTRAPYHATAPFHVTTLTSALHAPWALAVLPDGKILITERLPGAFRILNKQGVLSQPLPGLSGLSTDPETGLLDVVLDPHFAANHRIFFTFFGYADRTMGNTNVARARLDGDALTDVKVIFRSTPA